MEMYHFVTNWFFQSPPEKVWDELSNFASWPSWWPAWKKLSAQGEETAISVGSCIDGELRGNLPYTLKFQLEITRLQNPSCIAFSSTGGLVGSGSMLFEPKNDGTAVTIHWDVGTSSAFFNLAAKLPAVRKMMEKNHNEVMQEGQRLFRQRLT